MGQNKQGGGRGLSLPSPFGTRYPPMMCEWNCPLQVKRTAKAFQSVCTFDCICIAGLLSDPLQISFC